MALRALVTSGFWPVICVSAATASSRCFFSVMALPTPMLTTIFSSRGSDMAVRRGRACSARAGSSSLSILLLQARRRRLARRLGFGAPWRLLCFLAIADYLHLAEPARRKSIAGYGLTLNSSSWRAPPAAGEIWPSAGAALLAEPLLAAVVAEAGAGARRPCRRTGRPAARWRSGSASPCDSRPPCGFCWLRRTCL